MADLDNILIFVKVAQYESISRAAGSVHGEEMPPESMEGIIRSIAREPRQRTTLYGAVRAERTSRSFAARALSPCVETPARRYERRSSSGKAESRPLFESDALHREDFAAHGIVLTK